MFGELVQRRLTAAESNDSVQPEKTASYTPDECLFDFCYINKVMDFAAFEGSHIYAQHEGHYFLVQDSNWEAGEVTLHTVGRVEMKSSDRLLRSKRSWHLQPIPQG